MELLVMTAYAITEVYLKFWDSKFCINALVARVTAPGCVLVMSLTERFILQ